MIHSRAFNIFKGWLATSAPIPGEFFEKVSSEPVPHHLKRWWFCLGGTPAYLFIIQVVTGILLTFYYVPDPGHAYESVQHITYDISFGWVIRSIHKWSSQLMIIAVILHVMRIFFTGAYRKPRELNWMFGCGLLFCTLGFGFTGYSLIYEQLSYWGATVAANITQNVPLIGEYLARFMRGGDSVEENTLTRFFIFHIALLPLTITLLLTMHIALIRLIGVTEYQFEEDKGKPKKHFPFFPDHFLMETIIALFIALLLTLLVVFFPAGLGPPADPFLTPQHIKPEWYFYFTFRWLKLTSLQVGVLGTGVAAMVLLFWPFIDRFLVKKFPGRDLSIFLGVIGVITLLVLTIWEALV
ncbi:MAG: cytochrome bc complex cytochrome b subunit [Deltaproteobacteria bacterium]|nr:cytochrome bc complex cytochrome b subunit [Deltaproteobacteria bacterium]